MRRTSFITTYCLVIFSMALQIECYYGPRCTSSGLFPNPRTCLSYILCRSPGDVGDIIPCSPNGNGFDPRTKLCTLNRYSRICREGPVPKCLGPEHHGALASDPTLFFLCKASAPAIPTLYRCEPGLTFDPQTENCTSTTSSPCNGVQVQYGFFRKAVLGHCNLYVICTPQGKSLTLACPGNTVFDPRIRVCTQQSYGTSCFNEIEQNEYFRKFMIDST